MAEYLTALEAYSRYREQILFNGSEPKIGSLIYLPSNVDSIGKENAMDNRPTAHQEMGICNCLMCHPSNGGKGCRVAVEQKPSDPVREMFEGRIKSLDADIREWTVNVDSLSKRLNKAQGQLNGKIAARRAIIDAMQKVCNVAAVPPEEQAIADFNVKMLEAANYYKPTAKETITKILGHSQSPIRPLSELGISNPARQPQKDFVVRFKCGCCVRFRDDYQMNENCRMENGCYLKDESAKVANQYYRKDDMGEEGRPPLDPNIVSAQWEQPK